MYFVLAYIIDATLLSPSLVFTALIYGPIYATTHLIQMYMRYDMSDSQVFLFNVALVFIIISNALCIYYIIQTRELSRFYQQQATA